VAQDGKLRSMLVHTCDRCKKPITDFRSVIKSGVGLDVYEFCTKCGASIVRILKNYLLIPRDVTA